MSSGDYPDLFNVKKILIIKLRELGDVLLTGPVFTALQERLPEAEIDAYVYSESIPLLEGNPSVHGFIGYDRKWKKKSLISRLFNEWQILRKIRRNRYDLVINLTEGDRGAIAAKFARAPIRVGMDPKGSGLLGKKKLYTHIVKSCPGLRHTVERNLDAIRRIGVFPSFEQRELFLDVQSEAIRNMKAIAGSDFVLIHPASRLKSKCWPVEKMRALATALLSEGKKLVFTSGPDAADIEMVRQIGEGLEIINLAGQISLHELVALVSLSQVLVCVDSVPFHIASALKKPVVAIFGPSSDVTWGPWRNPNATVVSQSFSCRPCYQNGCGGSGVSDCLVTLPVDVVLKCVLNKGNIRDGSLRQSSYCGLRR